MIDLLEKSRLLKWLHQGERSPHQLNGLFASDCELLKIGSKNTLAVTTDTISEEIALGLYQDPYTAGYIAATASLSDLAAVGAEALGVLLSACFASSASDDFRARTSQGFADAASSGGTYVLGGDSSQGMHTVLTSTGVGTCERPVTRVGAQTGDVLMLTGKSGIGPLLAYKLLLGIKDDQNCSEQMFRPSIDKEAKRSFAFHARAMIDTSDGILAGVTTLCALNGVGARLFWNQDTLDEQAVSFAQQHNLPLWALWVAEHGDYQLLAAVDRDKVSGVKGLVVGEVTSACAIELYDRGRTLSVDPDWGQLVAQTHPAEYSARCSSLMQEFRERGFA